MKGGLVFLAVKKRKEDKESNIRFGHWFSGEEKKKDFCLRGNIHFVRKRGKSLVSDLGICLREKEGCQRGGSESLALFVLVSSLFLHLAFVEVVMQYVSMIFVFSQMK